MNEDGENGRETLAAVMADLVGANFETATANHNDGKALRVPKGPNVRTTVVS